MGSTANSTFGIFFEPLLKDFGWTRAVTSGAMSIAALVGSVFNIVGGRLSDRFPPGLLITIGSFFTGLGLVLMSQISAPWQLCACFCIIAVGGSFYLIPITSTVARWFIKRRGMMTSLLISALGTCEMVMPLLARWLISSYGWRNSYIILGIFVFAVIFTASFVIKRDPSTMGLMPYGAGGDKQANIKLQGGGLSLSESVHTRDFWIFIAVMICYFFGQSAVSTHIVIHATGLGFSRVAAVNILLISGALYIVSLNVTGNLVERIGKRNAVAIGFILQAAALFGYMASTQIWMFYASSVLFGLGRGAAMAPMPLLMADLFGLKSFGVIQGAIFTGAIAGSIFGPILTGYLFDLQGSYFLAFFICAAITLVGLFLTFSLRQKRISIK
jgi:MFS family permease